MRGEGEFTGCLVLYKVMFNKAIAVALTGYVLTKGPDSCNFSKGPPCKCYMPFFILFLNVTITNKTLGQDTFLSHNLCNFCRGSLCNVHMPNIQAVRVENLNGPSSKGLSLKGGVIFDTRGYIL
jgi:hypothetical protein